MADVSEQPKAETPKSADALPRPSLANEGEPVTSATPEIGASASGRVKAPTPVRPDSDVGKIVGGLVTSISSEELCLTLDDGRPAVINRANFDEAKTDPSTVYNVGDRVEGAVLTREDPKQRVVLSRAWALKKAGWEAVEAAVKEGALLRGTVTSASKRGVVVDVGVRGFVPTSHLELDPPKNLAEYVGQTFEFRVLEADLLKERLVLSRRSALLKEQRSQIHDLLAGLTVGETRAATISSLSDYGAFVDLGGVNGLIHLSELCWRRVGHPSEAVSVGQAVEVKILDVKIKKRRVSLSIRQLSVDPLAALQQDSIVEGPVARLVDFGAFVDLGDGVEGLVHLSELAEYRVSAPEEIVTPGEVVRTRVLSIDRKRRRVELSIRQAVSGEFG